MSVSPSVSASAQVPGTPKTPTQADLLDFVRRTAADTELIASLPLDPEGRTWVRLEGPGGSEAWLIGWPPGTGTGWHDHADSVGAFLTASGELKENSLAARLPTDGWKTLELTEGVDRERRLPSGQGRASAATMCTRCSTSPATGTRSPSTPTTRPCRRSAATAVRDRFCAWSTSSARRTGSEPSIDVSEQPDGTDELLDHVLKPLRARGGPRDV